MKKNGSPPSSGINYLDWSIHVADRLRARNNNNNSNNASQPCNKKPDSSPPLHLWRSPRCVRPSLPLPCADIAASTPKSPIHPQETRPRPPLESRQGTHPPLGRIKRGALRWDPISHRTVVPRGQIQARPCRPGAITMHILYPAKHGPLVLRQLPIPEPPRVNPQLLPVEVLCFRTSISAKPFRCYGLAKLGGQK